MAALSQQAPAPTVTITTEERHFFVELGGRIAKLRKGVDMTQVELAEVLGVARQTVLHKVQRGELAAVYVQRGKRKGLRIQVKADQAGLFDNNDRKEAQC